MKRIDTINVIPFIDIMLVLLAIVLTTATFIVEGRLDIRLPKAAAQEAATSAGTIEIAIDAEGQVYYRSEPVPIADLGPRLDSLPKDTPIELRVDAQARFARFVAVVDLLKARGLQRLTILTRET
jgi:biopolymer transport protein ExbD